MVRCRSRDALAVDAAKPLLAVPTYAGFKRTEEGRAVSDPLGAVLAAQGVTWPDSVIVPSRALTKTRPGRWDGSLLNLSTISRRGSLSDFMGECPEKTRRLSAPGLGVCAVVHARWRPPAAYLAGRGFGRRGRSGASTSSSCYQLRRHPSRREQLDRALLAPRFARVTPTPAFRCLCCESSRLRIPAFDGPLAWR